MNDNKYINPPGAAYDIIDHPSGENKAIEIALMRDHRFAFYYWFKWWKEINWNLSSEKAPPLISIDWHRDLCPPCEQERDALQQMNLKSYKETALFCWEKLNPLNDGHILSAAYLNLVGDIYVLCKQYRGETQPNFMDQWNNEHLVKCFDSPTELYQQISSINDNKVYFDIDLDYFVDSKDPCGGGSVELRYDDIKTILQPNTDLMKWLFKRMEGMTIATEPEFCGGLSNSNHIFNNIDELLFNSSLFGKSATWVHLN